MMRQRKRLLWGAAFVVGLAAVSWLFVNTFPDRTFYVYSQARSWFAASGPVQRLNPQTATPRDATPCRGTLQFAGLPAPDRYLPPGVLECNPKADESLIDWNTAQLKALEEPSLWALSRRDSSAMVYRFLWLRSFDHPISVRLVVNPDLTGTVISKIGGGAGGYEPGSLIHNESAQAGKHGTSVFLARILQTHFWDLASRRQQTGLDGAEWILEGVSSGHYQIVDRWSPGDGDAVRTLGMTLLSDLAGIRIDPKDVY